MVTTFGSYATAPSSRGSTDIAQLLPAALEERQAAGGPADEFVEGISGGGHDRRGAGIAEVALDANLLAEGGATTNPHGEVRDLRRELSGGSLHFEDSQHGVLARGLGGGDSV